MMGGAQYLLDANVFIEASRRYYAFDLAPAFWNVLISLARNGKIQSIDRVQNEILRGDDDLAAWVDNEFSGAFVSTNDESVIEAYRAIIAWVQSSNQYSDAAKRQFAEGADGWLVAYAKQNGCKVVTQETLNQNIRNRIPIPNVCQAFGVSFVDTFRMLRDLEVKLSVSQESLA